MPRTVKTSENTVSYTTCVSETSKKITKVAPKKALPVPEKKVVRKVPMKKSPVTNEIKGLLDTMCIKKQKVATDNKNVTATVTKPTEKTEVIRKQYFNLKLSTIPPLASTKSLVLVIDGWNLLKFIMEPMKVPDLRITSNNLKPVLDNTKTYLRTLLAGKSIGKFHFVIKEFDLQKEFREYFIQLFGRLKPVLHIVKHVNSIDNIFNKEGDDALAQMIASQEAETLDNQVYLLSNDFFESRDNYSTNNIEVNTYNGLELSHVYITYNADLVARQAHRVTNIGLNH